MTAQELRQKLDALPTDQDRFDVIRAITDAGHASDYGAYVEMMLKDREDQFIAVLKRLTNSNEAAWNLIGRLQGLEEIRTVLLQKFVADETEQPQQETN
ncbi:MAG: hypothetical protein WC683_07220 [bacterium]